jgi:DinB superfamily
MDWMEHDFVPAAEAMPEEKFFWAPKVGEFQGVRSFAEQILHVAEVNFALSATILSERPPAETDLPGHNSETNKTRSAVIESLKDSFAYTHKALSSITQQNARLPVKHPFFDMMTTRLGLGIVVIAHPFIHYGQMASICA